jgi:anaerobic magnesium-protoporphyrin IX monomethyl ester cyclase
VPGDANCLTQHAPVAPTRVITAPTWSFYNRRFNAYDVDRVVSELVELVTRHRLHEIALVDSNFLVTVHRAVAIAKGIVDSGARFSWSFLASTDLLCRMSDDEVELLGRSGFWLSG